MFRSLRVEIICLGDELLLGLKSNGHLRLLGDLLSTHALPVRRAHEIPDHPTVIRETLADAWNRADLIITTGGLGPTSDDLTREAIAETLGRKLVHSPAQESTLRKFYQARGHEPTPESLKQCLLLEGAKALANTSGTAPGQWLEADGKILVMLPGPPRELEPMFCDQVLPRLVEKGWARQRERFLQLRTTGISELALARVLQPIIEPQKDRLLVGYCPHEGMVDVRLSAIDDALETADVHAIGEAMKAALGDDFSHFGEEDLPAVILKQLRERGRKLAVAESCTGGLLASRFTDIAGASRVFMGGLVCYRNEAKENLLDIPHELLRQHGAVSPEASVAMATAVAEAFETEYALSVTGYAGPEGGREPAGTIYLGLASPVGVWARKVVAPGTRGSVKVHAVNAALDFLRRKLKKYEVHDFLDRMCL